LSGIKEPLDKHPWLEIKYIYQAGSTLKIAEGDWQSDLSRYPVYALGLHAKSPLSHWQQVCQSSSGGLFAFGIPPPPSFGERGKFRPFRISKSGKVRETLFHDISRNFTLFHFREGGLQGGGY
jgi:hypothetical protein